MPQTKTILAVTVLLVIFTVACVFVYLTYLSPSGFKARENAVLSQITENTKGVYTTLGGEEIALTEYTGDVLVVNVWASWSPYTETDHRILDTLKRTYGERVTVRAVNRMESKETAAAYLEGIGMKDGIEYVIDAKDHFFGSTGGFAMPETIVFDAIGNIYFHKRGVLDEVEIQEVLKNVLEGK